MEEFHFLRPAWLLALPAGLALVWAYARRLRSGERWRDLCDPALLPHLLLRRDVKAFSLLPLLMGCGFVLAVLALAGPAWHSRDLPVHRVLQARIVVLDLSRSMDAPDLPPSRLARARLKAAEIFAMTEEGQAGLVVYAGDAFLVSPLTDDGATLNAMLPALTTDLMPARGSRADLGLRRAGELLAQAGHRYGEIILIADSADDVRAVEAAAELAGKGFTVSVLAAGTPEGAPIPLPEGGFLKDDAGTIVVPRAGTRELREVARAGGGRFARMSGDHRDLQYLLSSRERWRHETEESEHAARNWRDEGPWLVLALLPLAALAFRRGWLLAIACLLVAPLEPAHALEWQDLWARPDQQAAAALARGDPVAAIDEAESETWRAPALYRNREYAAAAGAYGGLEGADAHYNRGNALAHAGRLRDALDAYDEALALVPDLEDAIFNRQVVEELLRRNQSGGEQGERGEGGDTGTSGSMGAESFRPDDQAPGDGDPRGESSPPDLQGTDRGNAQSGSGTTSGASDAASREAPRSAAELGDRRREVSGGDQPASSPALTGELSDEQRQALEQWLRRIPDDPGGLLRRKFALDYQRRGNPDPDTPRTW